MDAKKIRKFGRLSLRLDWNVFLLPNCFNSEKIACEKLRHSYAGWEAFPLVRILSCVFQFKWTPSLSHWVLVQFLLMNILKYQRLFSWDKRSTISGFNNNSILLMTYPSIWDWDGLCAWLDPGIRNSLWKSISGLLFLSWLYLLASTSLLMCYSDVQSPQHIWVFYYYFFSP